MEQDRHVHLVDDEAAIRRSLTFMLKLGGYRVSAFESGRAFLDAVGGLHQGCILLDVRMPDMDGLEVQQELNRRSVSMPVILMTGHGELAVAVSALRAGAVDFVEKPFERARLLASLDRAWLGIGDPDAHAALGREAAAMVASLTEQERAILDVFSQGLSNSAAAAALGIPVGDVEVARASLTEKLGGTTLSDAIRIAYLAQSQSIPPLSNLT
jgi:two-component system response regulator FixJ